MLKKWVLKVLATVPYLGNVVYIPYKVNARDKVERIARLFIATTIDINGNVVTVPLVYTKSDFNDFVKRVSKYVDAEGGSVGRFLPKVCVQSSTKNYKKQITKELLVGSITVNSNMNTVVPIALTRSQFDEMNDRYYKQKDKFNLKITLKQKIALFIGRFYGYKEKAYEL